jgi:hypothetical protein
MRFRKE